MANLCKNLRFSTYSNTNSDKNLQHFIIIAIFFLFILQKQENN